VITARLKLSLWTSFFAATSAAAALAIPASFLRLYYPTLENSWGVIIPAVFAAVFLLDHFRLMDLQRFRDALMSAFVGGLIASVVTALPLVLILLAFYPEANLKGNFALPQMTGGFAFLAIFTIIFLNKFLRGRGKVVVPRLPERPEAPPYSHLLPVARLLAGRETLFPMDDNYFYVTRDGWRCDLREPIDFELVRKRFEFPPTIILSEELDQIFCKNTWVEIKGNSSG
jgi:hypothetical protein